VAGKTLPGETGAGVLKPVVIDVRNAGERVEHV
jgi:hypothetical protein